MSDKKKKKLIIHKPKKLNTDESDNESDNSFDESDYSTDSDSPAHHKTSVPNTTNIPRTMEESEPDRENASDSENINSRHTKNKRKILNYNKIADAKKQGKQFIVGSDSDTSDESNNSESGSDKEHPLELVQPKNIEKSVKNSNEIFKELIKHQLPDVPTQWKLNINDMKRICKYINTSIFDKKNCCIWNGYITNMNNSNKGTYVNFYFRNKKVALHRLLYSNFVAPLDSSEYLKFNCENKGICCNINHYEKYKYSKNNIIAKKEIKHREPKKEIKEITIIGPDDPDKLIIDFD